VLFVRLDVDSTAVGAGDLVDDVQAEAEALAVAAGAERCIGTSAPITLARPGAVATRYELHRQGAARRPG